MNFLNKKLSLFLAGVLVGALSIFAVDHTSLLNESTATRTAITQPAGQAGQDAFTVQSTWEWEHWRGGKQIGRWTDHNIIPNESLDDILDVYFSDGTQKTTHYLLIYESDTSPSAGMTYATPVFTESTAYTESTRPAWTEAGVSSQSITNSASRAEFTINASKTIYGAGMVCGGTDADTKGDAAGGGVLNHVSAFTSGSKAVESSDVLKVTVSITMSDV